LCVRNFCIFELASSPKFDVSQIMKILKLNLLSLLLLFFVTSCQKDEGFIEDEANYSIDLNLANETDWQMADEILVLVNLHRASVNLPAILKDQQYASAYAVEHTLYMIEKSEINHDNFNIRTEALKEKGAIKVGENVAFGYTSAESVVSAWLNSPSHKRAIEGNYTHSGFGVMKGSNGGYYFTQLFYRN
jgi:uncharacterized protein YkwD